MRVSEHAELSAPARTPISTYRVQLTAEFPLDAVASTCAYLRDLGADWVYLSPILASADGSTHGYDVVDPSRVDPARGGARGLANLSAKARDAGLGVLVDIVPNHEGVATPSENPWWWDVLAHGETSQWAGHFDIDWTAGGGKIRLPVLAEADAAQAAREGRLVVRDGELHYGTVRYPIAAETEIDTDGRDAPAVHDRQHYELVNWRRADSELNYRRFFAVSDLAGIRVEIPEVFDDAHVEVLRWFQEGLVDGLRVDHPDGLSDPGGYLERLVEKTGGAYVLVEKILARGEVLPAFWPVAGTTGYDALADFDRVLIDPSGESMLDGLDASLRGAPLRWADALHAAKREIAEGILQSEVRRLVRDLEPETRSELEDDSLADAFAEVLACFPVYRTYLPYGVEHLDEGLVDARRRRPDLAAALDAVGSALHDPRRPVARRFQQTSGMVMAKSVEDTAFYRTSRLATLTEVGADPMEFAITPDEFHARQVSRLATAARSMTALSTHDTKRGEDTRARISVLAEVPDEWAAFVARRRAVLSLGDGPFENLLWQSVIGAWPRERDALHAYAEKAAREAATSTSWAQPAPDFESRLHSLVDSFFDDPGTASDINQMVARIARAGWSNSLALKLLQLTSPGVPDVYQGSELWDNSLVDPDNRRPVDFEERRRLLARIDAGWRPTVDTLGAAKLLVTSRALRARRDRPELFERYVPLPALGSAPEHAIAVDRGGAIVVATRLPLGLATRGGWGDTVVMAPTGRYRDAISGAVVHGGHMRVQDLMERYPVALLLPEAT